MAAMPFADLRLADAVAILERTPASLAALLDGLPDTWIRATEGKDTWSPYDVIGHLIHAERTDWIPRAALIVEGTMRPFAPFDREAQFEESRGKTLAELLAEFAAARRDSLSALKRMGLTDRDLPRPGMHPELGSVSLGQLLATWVVHDLDHVTQVARTMAKTYTEAVGPWSAYLSVLRDRTK
jgi:DinB superfamily